MAKLIAVCGATGQLGGSVARRMLQEGWKVRAITRNPSSAAAQALSSAGAEVITADYDDASSLAKAFSSVQAIFAVTQFWEHIMSLGATGAGEKEYAQMLAIAKAADATEGLEHFILHSLGSGEKLKGKEYAVPHWDYKDKACDDIKTTYPKLAGKMTMFWVGYFSSNMWTLHAPAEVKGTYGGYLWANSVPDTTTMWVSGDIENNVGIYAAAVLANPQLTTPFKIVHVHTDVLPMGDCLKQWNEVTGNRGIYSNIGGSGIESLMGPFGGELHSQMRLNEAESDWEKVDRERIVAAKELGIEGKLLNHRQSLEKNKAKLVAA